MANLDTFMAGTAQKLESCLLMVIMSGIVLPISPQGQGSEFIVPALRRRPSNAGQFFCSSKTIAVSVLSL